MTESRTVAVVAANRIPFARQNTAYHQLSNQTMLTDTLEGLVKKAHLDGERLGEVVGGAVLKHASDWNLLRECVLGTSLNPHTPAYDVQQACCTSLEATILVANKIALGQIEAGIACGTDTTSDAPVGVNRRFQRGMMDLNAARSLGAKVRAVAAMANPANLAVEIPGIREPRTGKTMGQHAQITADELSVSRQEMDEVALASHRNLAKAYDDGFFGDLVMPYHGLSQDNNLRRDSSLEKMARLPGVFGGTGSHSAANSTPFTDGASAVLLASEDWAEERGLPIMARITAAQTGAVDYVTGKEGLLMAPATVVPRMLAKENLALQDFDYYELHEAFASVVLCTVKAWQQAGHGEIDRAKINVNGSSIATGHPFAATGTRIVGTLAKLLQQRGRGRGLVSVCAAGGQGAALVMEA